MSRWPDLLAYGLFLWLAAVNLAGFALMGRDKGRAKRPGARRVSEKALLLTALAGGAAGALCGMHLFRHKTRHWYFRRGLPLMLAAQLGLAVWLIFL